MTSTGFSIFDLAHSGVSSKSSDGDFVLKLNTIEPVDLSWAETFLDRSKYRLKIIPVVVSMSDYYIPVPLAHLLNGLRFPLDPSFVDFLLMIKSQPAHVHLNVVRYVMSLIVLCRRVGVEMTEMILRTFFSVLGMNNRIFSLRPRPNVVTLFDAIPNKVLDWREKWLYVECNTGFPFPPLVMNLEAWHPVGKRPVYFEGDKHFLDFVGKELGTDPKKQTKVFLTEDLLSPDSLNWCGIGGRSVESRQKELGLEDTEEYPAWRLHPNGSSSMNALLVGRLTLPDVKQIRVSAWELYTHMICVSLFCFHKYIHFD